jgi:hypothetical protein
MSLNNISTVDSVVYQNLGVMRQHGEAIEHCQERAVQAVVDSKAVKYDLKHDNNK